MTSTIEKPAAAPLETIPDGELRLIPIGELRESEWNPRKYFPAAAMAELTASMRTNGFRDWLPLLTRPGREDGFEIGAGHRRSRAARAAGIAMIPCIVRDLTDEQFLEVLNFDNAGREDVHPLEEAAGWRHLMEHTGMSVLDIAARIGKSKEYVYQGLKYDSLIPEVRQTFIDRGIKAGHAILIARLAPELQLEALREGCFDWQNNLVSTKQLARWIQRKVNGADLSDAPFGRGDAELVATAGSCAECPKCQGDLCMDRTCYDGKIAAHVARQSAAGLVAVSNAYNASGVPAGVLLNQEFATVYERESDEEDLGFEDGEEPGEPKEEIPEPRCAFAESAIVAHGDDVGKTIRICRNPKCPEHGSQLRRFEGSGRMADGKKDIWAERAKALPQKIKFSIRKTLLERVLAAYAKKQLLTHEDLQLIAEALVTHSTPPELIEAFRFPWQKGGDQNGSAHSADMKKTIRADRNSPAGGYLPAILVGLSLQETAKEFCFEDSAEAKRLHRAAELAGVDAKTIAANVTYNLTEEFKWKRAAAMAKRLGKPAPPFPQLRTAYSAVDEEKAKEPQGGTRKEIIKQLPAMGAAKTAAKKKKLVPAKKPPVKKAAKKGGKK